MKKNIYLLILFLVFFLAATEHVLANLKINEIYPAPATDELEWIEIYNQGEIPIDLSNYYLTDYSGKRIEIDSSVINAYSFVIASTPSGVLNNSNQTGKDFADIVYLYNNLHQNIDIATYSGSFASGKTFARCPDGSENWILTTSLTKNFSNNLSCPTPTNTPTPLPQTPTPTPEPAETPTPTIDPQVVANIYLSEVLPNPEDGNEWVELYNNNSHQVTLTDWYIDDTPETGSAPKKFTLTIPALSYSTIELFSAIFNNSGDMIRLLKPDKSELESFEYQASIKGKSFSKQQQNRDENWCLTTPSKNLSNNPCEQSPPTNNNLTNSISTTNTQIQNNPSLTQTNPYQLQNSKEPQQLKINLHKTTLEQPKRGSVLGEATNKTNTQVLQQAKRYLLFLKMLFSLNLMLSFSTLCYIIYIYHDFFKEAVFIKD